jgi:hypothetical protein
MASVERMISERLRLTVNPLKSAVDRPAERRFLGFTVSRRDARLKVADKALERLKANVRALTRRTRGHRLDVIVAELRKTLLGWKAYFGIAEVLSPLHDIDKWIRRKLRCYLWKQWGRAGYRELRKRGVSVEHQQIGAWPLAAEQHPGTEAGITKAVLHEPGAAGHCGAVGIYSSNRRVRDPYARWCGRRGAVRRLPIPIRHHEEARHEYAHSLC